jgi:F0F1-type ATP synthase membrane subunit a
MVEHARSVNVGGVDCRILIMSCVLAGQVAGVASVEFGLANMIWAAVVIAKVKANGWSWFTRSLMCYICRTATML